MALAVVLGVILKVDMMGYEGPPPQLPAAPISEERGRDGYRRFVYDLSPSDPCLSVEDACAKLGSRLERMLNSSRSALPETPFAARLTLEFGLLADREDESFAYSWPPDFLRVLVDAEIQLNVTHYLPKPEAGDGADTLD